MRLYLTNRLITGLLAAASGLVVAIVAGRPEAAVLILPWAVLLVLGLAGVDSDRSQVQVRLALDRDQVAVDGPVSVTAEVDGLSGGWVQAIWLPQAAFSSRPNHGDPSQQPTADQEENEEKDADIDVAEVLMTAADVVDDRGRVELVCTGPAVAWGTHDVGRVELHIHHPFGLTTARGVARHSLPVRVHPRPIDLRRLLAPWYVRRLSGAHRSRSAARGVEYADIRPYGPGDSPRDINWRASARSQELLVSQRHPDRSTHVILLVDSFAESGADLPAILGETIEAAVALAESHLSVSDRVGLIDLGGVIRWVTPGSGRHHLQRLVDTLLRTRLHRSDADRSIASLPARALPPRSFVVAVSPLLDPRFIEALIVLRAAGHDVAAVELTHPIDPSSPRWNRSGASALALRLWGEEMALTRDRLARNGIAVAIRPIGSTTSETGADPTGPEPWDQTLHRLEAARRRLRPPVVA